MSAVDRPAWTFRAACAGSPITMFFPADTPDPTPDNPKPSPPYFDSAPALAVCAGCDVRRECLAAHRDEGFGVYGGTTPAGRGFARGSYTRSHRRPA